MRIENRGRWLLLSSAALLAAVACGPGGPKEPPSVQHAREVLGEAWNTTGPQGKWLVLGCLAQAPEISFARGKAEAVFEFASKNQRQDVVRALAGWEDESLAPIFTRLLEDEDDLIRLLAAKALAGFGDGAGAQQLLDHRRGRDGELNPEYCGLLHKAGDDTCFEEAKKDLRSKNAVVSAAAAATLAEFGTPEAAQELRARLGNLHGERRAPAIEALGLISEEPNDVPLVLSFIGYRENVLAVIHALGELGGDQAVEALKKTLAKNDPLADAHAAAALAQLGVIDDDVRQALEAAAQAESVKVRYDLAARLSDAPPAAEVRAALGRLAADDEPKVASLALQSLRDGLEESDFAPLEAAWNKYKDSGDGPGYQVSMAALAALSHVPGEQAQQLLVGAVDDMNWGRAVQAAIAVIQRYERDHPVETPAG